MNSQELDKVLNSELEIVDEPLLDFTIELEREEDMFFADEDGRFHYVRFTRHCSLKVTITDDEILLDPDCHDTCYTVDGK